MMLKVLELDTSSNRVTAYLGVWLLLCMLLTSSQTEGFSKIDTLSFNWMAFSCCGRLGSTETSTNKVETTTRKALLCSAKEASLSFGLFSF
jgi:hypothetical protein